MATRRGALIPVGTLQKRSRSSLARSRSLTWPGVVAPFLEVANRVTSVAIVARGRAPVHLRFTPRRAPIRSSRWFPRTSLRDCSWKRCSVEAEPSSTKPRSFQRAARRHRERSAGSEGPAPGDHRILRRRLRWRGPSTIRHLLNLPFERRRIPFPVSAGGYPDQRGPSRGRAAALPQQATLIQR